MSSRRFLSVPVRRALPRALPALLIAWLVSACTLGLDFDGEIETDNGVRDTHRPDFGMPDVADADVEELGDGADRDRPDTEMDAPSLPDLGPDTPQCGDGWVHSAEQCDDGNLAPGDGCDASCVIEGGSICNGQPSICTPPFQSVFLGSDVFFQDLQLTGRSAPDAVAYRVDRVLDDRLVLRTEGEPGGIVVGDELLLVMLWRLDNDDVGHAEFVRVRSITGEILGVDRPLPAFDGFEPHNTIVIAQRVPAWKDVTVGAHTIRANPYNVLPGRDLTPDGIYTGIIAFRASGEVSVADGGSIDASMAGFPGGRVAESTALHSAGLMQGGRDGGDGAVGVGGGEGGNPAMLVEPEAANITLADWSRVGLGAGGANGGGGGAGAGAVSSMPCIGVSGGSSLGRGGDVPDCLAGTPGDDGLDGQPGGGLVWIQAERISLADGASILVRGGDGGTGGAGGTHDASGGGGGGGQGATGGAIRLETDSLIVGTDGLVAVGGNGGNGGSGGGSAGGAGGTGAVYLVGGEPGSAGMDGATLDSGNGGMGGSAGHPGVIVLRYDNLNGLPYIDGSEVAPFSNPDPVLAETR